MSVWSLIERAFGWSGVVAYHGVGDSPHSPTMHISPGRLHAQLEYLRDHHTVVPLRELVERWRAGASTRGCVAITFDDAYAGVATHALPILQTLDLPATVFVASDYAARGASYWWDDVERQRLAHRGGAWCVAPSAVGLPAFPAADEIAMDRIRSHVIAHFGGRWPHGLSDGGRTIWRALDFQELYRLASDRRIEFGVHTLSHPALPFLPYSEQVGEIRENFALLRDRLPRVLPVVAYPYGLYNRSTVRAAREAGMTVGLTMEQRASAEHPNPMLVPRVGGSELRDPQSLARRLNRALRPAFIIRSGGPHPRLPIDRIPLAPVQI